MKNHNFSIKILGSGMGGINIIKPFAKVPLKNVECLDMHADWASKITNKFIKIGTKTTRGLGTGALPLFGEEDKDAIVNAISGCDLLILVSGLGGGTGSGASPVVAEIAKELDIPTAAFVTTPLGFESKMRHQNTQVSLEKLKSFAGVLIVFSCEEYMSHVPKKTPIGEIFKRIDEILQKNIIKMIDFCNLQASNGKSAKEILKLIKFDDPCINVFKTI